MTLSPALNGLSAVDARLCRVLAIHFDPESGAPFWLEVARKLGFDPRHEIRTIHDLAALGPMDEDALASRPIEDFVPRLFWVRKAEWLVAETGGTLGRPKFTVHRRDEFTPAFVDPFVAAARRANFPTGVNWLFIGPTGPHIIGHAARACARAMGAPAPFTIDFDPRWAKKLPEDSFARERYRTHLQQQALHILQTQSVGVIFSTPAVLEGLGEQLPAPRRLSVGGIHFGGMPVSSPLRERLAELFPRAVLLSGYGNTLLGMAPELAYAPETGIDYFPLGSRLILQVIPIPDQGGTTHASGPVAYGERGRVLAHRLDETQLIVNLLERDSAIRIPPPHADPADDFTLDGIRDPQPLAVGRSEKTGLGLY